LLITNIAVILSIHQERTGKDGRVFVMLKFRTMIAAAEQGSAVWAKSDDQRVTWPGRWLRRTRIDELPQVWNVLKGKMSFVGPHPERPEFNAILEEQIPYYDLRHLIKPGMTGWAQVMYRYMVLPPRMCCESWNSTFTTSRTIPWYWVFLLFCEHSRSFCPGPVTRR
jgi:lipopolysaccharide/colanic/teichoic acid biosynthesis glycosyltransferase